MATAVSPLSTEIIRGQALRDFGAIMLQNDRVLLRWDYFLNEDISILALILPHGLFKVYFFSFHFGVRLTWSLIFAVKSINSVTDMYFYFR